MTVDVQTQFSTKDGERSYGRSIAELIRAGRHDLAEDRLITDLAPLGVPLAEICLETRAGSVELAGWDALRRTVARPPTGIVYTAVGLDLSAHVDPPATPEGWVEPGVEVSLYTDDAFPFSTASRDDLLAVYAAYDALRQSALPWTGAFEDIGACDVGTVGLARLNSAIVEQEPRSLHQPPPGDSPAPAAYVALRLAAWVRALRFHRAVKRSLDQQGLPRPVPVLVDSHDVRPYVNAVYFPPPTRS
jgi:hypothetical protein